MVQRLAVLLPALVLLTAAACGGGSSTTTPSPSPTFDILSPIGDTTVTPTPPASDTPYRFVYREFGKEQDIIWRVSPADPAQKEQVAVIPHRPDWGVLPVLSPDAKRLAYLAMPSTATDPSFQAEAYLLDLESGETRLIAKAVDLRFRPLWSPDGQLLYLRRNIFAAQEVMILRVDLREPGEGATPTPTITPRPDEDPANVHVILRNKISTVLSFIPIGFAADKRSLYFVQVEGGPGGGTVLGRYAPATAEAVAAATAIAEATATALAGSTESPAETPTPEATFVVRLSDQIARDYDLSPDAKKLIFLAPGLSEGQIVARAFVADLVGRSVTPLPADALSAGSHLRPLWHPDGTRVAVGLLPSPGQPGSVALAPLDGGAPAYLPPPDVGFDVPLSWAPDGTFLAVNSFQGDSLANPGRGRLTLVAPTGQRIDVAQGVDVEVLGWFKAQE